MRLNVKQNCKNHKLKLTRLATMTQIVMQDINDLKDMNDLKITIVNDQYQKKEKLLSFLNNEIGDYKCICNRIEKSLVCANCGHSAKGRILRICRKHPLDFKGLHENSNSEKFPIEFAQTFLIHNTITQKSRLTQKKCPKKTDAIFSIYGRNGTIP